MARQIGTCQAVLGALHEHPEISLLFSSASSQNAFSPVASQSGADGGIEGYRATWSALPRSIERIYVLRDVPHPRSDVIDCLESLGSTAARLSPGACSRPLASALLRDLQVEASRGLEPRLAVIDLSDAFCSRGRCSSVVGHAMVYRHSHHLTASFARSLAPDLASSL